eukprot:13210854-Alexandrium_andersonii.AAC.1
MCIRDRTPCSSTPLLAVPHEHEVAKEGLQRLHARHREDGPDVARRRRGRKQPLLVRAPPHPGAQNGVQDPPDNTPKDTAQTQTSA